MTATPLPAAAKHLTGLVTARQLRYWTEIGLLNAENPECGSGRRMRWPEHELTIAAKMARLTRMGLSVESAAVVARTPWEPAITLLLCACGVEKAPATSIPEEPTPSLFDTAPREG